MQINVSQLLQEPIGSVREYRIDEAADVISDGNRYPVRGDCRLLRTRQGVLTGCNLETEVELSCNRCLESYRQRLNVEFEEEFLQTVDVSTGVRLPAPEDPSAFTINPRHILDVTEAVRQYAVMALPLKPLCRESCAGLCPECGKNLNQGDCGCPHDTIDPRWAGLNGLR
jgi:uncharacterized protein